MDFSCVYISGNNPYIFKCNSDDAWKGTELAVDKCNEFIESGDSVVVQVDAVETSKNVVEEQFTNARIIKYDYAIGVMSYEEKTELRDFGNTFTYEVPKIIREHDLSEEKLDKDSKIAMNALRLWEGEVVKVKIDRRHGGNGSIIPSDIYPVDEIAAD